jgi:hypothetical protein
MGGMVCSLQNCFQVTFMVIRHTDGRTAAAKSNQQQNMKNKKKIIVIIIKCPRVGFVQFKIQKKLKS